MSGKFDAAINCLSVMADRDFANGAPHRGQFRVAISVLEAAGKVDKAKSIIARLRAADALCAAAGDLENLAKQLMKETEESYNEDDELADIRKAISDYEEAT
jgi:hypothetical protein